MPSPANAAQRHEFPKAQHQVKNWGEYDRALQERGSLTLWVTPEAIAAWHPTPTGKRGRARSYSDLAIETGHLLRLAFGRPWRQTEGLLRSITTLLDVGVGVPDHTTFSRRSPGLALASSSSPFDLSGVSATGRAGSDSVTRAGAGRLSLIQRRHGGARPLDRCRAALLRGLPRPAPGRQRLLRHGRLRLGRVLGVLRPEPLVSGPPAPACGRARPLQRPHPVRDEPHPR